MDTVEPIAHKEKKIIGKVCFVVVRTVTCDEKKKRFLDRWEITINYKIEVKKRCCDDC